ncbi:MAG: hypothetical protein ACO1NY_08425, partial [Pseudorhodoplanes sp.]
RLGHGRPLTFQGMVPMILIPGRLNRTLGFVHQRERREIARAEKTEGKVHRDRIWASHRERFHTLCARQNMERKAERDHQRSMTRDITFARAKSDLIRNLQEQAQQPEKRMALRKPKVPGQAFNNAAWAPNSVAPDDLQSRADRIRRDMEVWRRNNPDRDFGHEL